MKMTRRVLVASASLALGGTALAIDVDLAMTVSGSRNAAPKWQDSTSADVTTLDFAFSGVVGAAASDVDSATVQAKLVNAISYPASVAVTAPGTCSIGATNVSAADVKVLHNSGVASASINLANNTLQNFAVRFAAAGGYGDKAGAITCSSNGRLRYSY